MAKVIYRTGTPRLSVALKKEFINGKPWSPRIQRFNEAGFLEVDEDQEHGKKIIELLDNDSRYGKEFQRMSDEEKNAIADMHNEPIAHAPANGITEELIASLKYLEEKTEKDSLKPAEMKKVLSELETVIGEFQVHGIRKPKQGDSVRKVKASILEVLGTIEDFDLYPAKE